MPFLVEVIIIVLLGALLWNVIRGSSLDNNVKTILYILLILLAFGWVFGGGGWHGHQHHLGW